MTQIRHNIITYALPQQPVTVNTTHHVTANTPEHQPVTSTEQLLNMTDTGNGDTCVNVLNYKYCHQYIHHHQPLCHTALIMNQYLKQPY